MSPVSSRLNACEVERVAEGGCVGRSRQRRAAGSVAQRLARPGRPGQPLSAAPSWFRSTRAPQRVRERGRSRRELVRGDRVGREISGGNGAVLDVSGGNGAVLDVTTLNVVVLQVVTRHGAVLDVTAGEVVFLMSFVVTVPFLMSLPVISFAPTAAPPLTMRANTTPVTIPVTFGGRITIAPSSESPKTLPSAGPSRT